MGRKKWALLLLCILLVAGYFKFFFKTWDVASVAKSADYILSVDVKRVTNTVIWHYLTTPSQWKRVSLSRDRGVSWKDMVKVPDYFFVFHAAGHPSNAWYAVLDVKDTSGFNKGLLHYQFKRSGEIGREGYTSEQLQLDMVRIGGKVLIGNTLVADKNFIKSIANELFVQNQFVDKSVLAKNTGSGSHAAFRVVSNRFLEEDALLTANFDKEQILVDLTLSPRKVFKFTEGNFPYTQTSLFTSGFTRPPDNLYQLAPSTFKEKISRALNFDIDSVFSRSVNYYKLDVTGIKERIDSAISYTYDEEFNPIEKIVVNKVNEPAFAFHIKGREQKMIYDYWHRNELIEETSAGELFTPIPFVKSYCKSVGDELSVVSANYKPAAGSDSVSCIFFFNLLFPKIHPSLQNYVPPAFLKIVSNMESINLVGKKVHGDKISIRCTFVKKENDRPIIKW